MTTKRKGDCSVGRFECRLGTSAVCLLEGSEVGDPSPSFRYIWVEGGNGCEQEEVCGCHGQEGLRHYVLQRAETVRSSESDGREALLKEQLYAEHKAEHRGRDDGR